MIYFFQVSTTVLKVGYTANLAARLNDLKITSAEPRLLALCTGDRTAERQAHGYLRRWHIRGELFRLDAHLLEFLQYASDQHLLPFLNDWQAAPVEPSTWKNQKPAIRGKTPYEPIEGSAFARQIDRLGPADYNLLGGSAEYAAAMCPSRWKAA